eukprot:SAG31_NODE_4123_length_3561_cov_3.577701_1_plen_340_part_00
MPTAPSLARHELYYEFTGTAYEIGLQHGMALAAEIRREYEPALAACAASRGAGEDGHSTLSAFSATFLPVVEELLGADAVAEVAGTADGAGISFDAAFFAAYRDGWGGGTAPRGSDSDEGCTAFLCAADATNTGGIVLGQTKDTNAPLERYRVCRLRYSDSGVQHILCTYPGWAASWGLLMNGGLSWVGNSVYGLPAPASTRVLPTSILKRLAMQSSSVAQLMGTVRSKGLQFSDGAFTIGDRTGAAWLLESVAGRSEWASIASGTVVHANHVLSSTLSQFEDKQGGWGENFMSDSRDRQARLEVSDNELCDFAVHPSSCSDSSCSGASVSGQGSDRFD